MEFKENDFITLNVNNQRYHYIVKNNNVIGTSVSLYFAILLVKEKL